MGGLSLIVAVMPAMGLVALCTGLALTRITGYHSGRSDAGGWLARVDALLRVAAGRKAGPPQPAYGRFGALGYLYVPCVRMSGNGSPAGPRRWVQQVPIVKKTAKLIYYASDSWNRREAVVSPGCISREQFEADTRCHGRGYCPHGKDRCRHGYRPGVIPIPGGHRTGSAGRLFYATRQAAENDLYRAERARTGKTVPQAAPIRELRRAMLDAHPDRGGTAERFIQARCSYQAALRQA